MPLQNGRMPRFTHVEVYPPTGWPERRWGGEEEITAVQDAFLRASRPVCELYDESLRELKVEGLRGMLRLGCGHQPWFPDRVEVVIHVGKPYDSPGEMGAVRLCDSVGELTQRARAALSLEAVHAAVLELARVRAWDPAPFEQCRRHVIEREYVQSVASPWKSNPGNRWQARTVYRLAPDDGFGRCWLEVRGGAAPELVERGPEAVAFCTYEGFKRSMKTLRWSSKDEVGATPYCGLGTAWYSGRLGASRCDGAWMFEAVDEVTVRVPHGEGISPVGEAHETLPEVRTVRPLPG